MKNAALIKLGAPLAIAALALSACGGAEPAAEQAATSAPVQSAAVQPSQGSPDAPTSAQSSAPASAPTTQTALTQAELDAAADTLKKSHPGFRLREPETFRDRESAGGRDGANEYASPAACRAHLTGSFPSAPTDRVGAGITRDSTTQTSDGLFASVSIESSTDAEFADKMIDHLEKQAEVCADATFANQEKTTSMQITTFTPQGVGGDRVFGMTTSVTSGAVTSRNAMVVVRRGNALVMALASIDPQSPSLDGGSAKLAAEALEALGG